MAEVTWRITTHTPPQSLAHAAVEAFCAVRRPDTIATIFEVDGVPVDLTREIETRPALRDAGERVYYLLPLDGDGPAAGPFREGELPAAIEGPVLTMDLLTGAISVKSTP